jgi:ABC-type phosphate/phosphonate transport system substrate-binding protein
MNICLPLRIGLLAALLFATTALGEEKSAAPLTLVVMDPLAAPLSCPCVKGYAQRDYEQLAKYLTEQLGAPVKTVFNESLKSALKETKGQADIVIGKRSVVLADAKKAGLQMKPILALSGKDGQTIITGLFVVPAADPAVSVADLKTYRIIFGSADADEKHSAALSLLKLSGVSVPKDLETCEACSDGATTILELGPSIRGATVISSYAAPLLEGCGTIKKGDLRVVGTTDPVPFVVAFVSKKVPAPRQAAIQVALLKAGAKADLREALETKLGFVPEPAPVEKKSPLSGK